MNYAFILFLQHYFQRKVEQLETRSFDKVLLHNTHQDFTRLYRIVSRFMVHLEYLSLYNRSIELIVQLRVPSQASFIQTTNTRGYFLEDTEFSKCLPTISCSRLLYSLFVFQSFFYTVQFKSFSKMTSVGRVHKNLVYTVLKSPLSDKKSREQFQIQHKGYHYYFDRNDMVQANVFLYLLHFIRKQQVLLIEHVRQSI